MDSRSALGAVISADVLTDDLLLKLFEYFKPTELANLTNVCKRWGALAAVQFRRMKSLPLFINHSNDALILKMLQLCGPALQLFSLNDRFIPAAILTALRQLSGLKTLNLNHCSFNFAAFLDVLGSLSHITTLQLQGVNKGDVSDLSFVSLVGRLPLLVALDVREQYATLGRFLAHTTTESLREIQFSDCILSPGSLTHLAAKHGASLVNFHASQCKILSQFFTAFCERLVILQKLNVTKSRFCDSLEQGLPSSLLCISYCRNLTHLHASRTFPTIDNTVLTALAINCPSLCHLCVAGNSFDDGGLCALNRLTNLQYLDISEMFTVHDWSMISLSGCRKLRTLLYCHCSQLTGSFLSSLFINCPDLECLGLTGCRILNSRDLIDSCIDYLRNRKSTDHLTIYSDGTLVSTLFNVDPDLMRNLPLNILSDLSCTASHHCCDLSFSRF